MTLKNFFENIAEIYYDVVDRVWYDVGYYHRKEAEFLRQILTFRPGIAMDMGCGPGRHVTSLLSKANKVIAVDFARRMLELTKAEVPSEKRSQVEFVQADIRFLPFKGNVADFILNLEVLEHLPGGMTDVSASLCEFRRILKQSGSIVTEVPLRRHMLWHYFYPRMPSWKEIPENLKTEYYRRFGTVVDNVFYDEDIESFLREAGFGLTEKSFIRVLPAGLIEKHQNLTNLDNLLERVPVLNRLAREVIWLAKPVRSVESRRGGNQ